MGILAWIVVGLVVKNLLVGIVGALVGGFLFSSLRGASYYRDVNAATIFVVTVGAVVFLYILDWLRGLDRLPDRRR